MANWLKRYYDESEYAIFFDRDDGTFIRYGKDDIDPFCNKMGPELLDISITNFCERGCDFCYRKSNKEGRNMSLDEYRHIMSQAKKVGVLQVALGGGNPNQHPDFIEILRITNEYNIVPSYTTNGQGMTDEIYNATKKYCGAMAVSWYEPFIDAQNVIERAASFKITNNIHYLLDINSLPKAIELMENRKDILEKINALIFLNYKPIHSSESFCLKDDDTMRHFFDLIKAFKTCHIGFDSCMVSYLTLMGTDLLSESVDFCEAGRFSAYISEDLKLYPCSFLNDISTNGIDLRTRTLEDGWRHGEDFVKMREKLNSRAAQDFPISACLTCDSYGLCHGGCQILNINRCREHFTDAVG
jgi:radical SAM protein with 4Fe4S-binding SPASM domain